MADRYPATEFGGGSDNTVDPNGRPVPLTAAQQRRAMAHEAFEYKLALQREIATHSDEPRPPRYGF